MASGGARRDPRRGPRTPASVRVEELPVPALLLAGDGSVLESSPPADQLLGEGPTGGPEFSGGPPAAIVDVARRAIEASGSATGQLRWDAEDGTRPLAVRARALSSRDAAVVVLEEADRPPSGVLTAPGQPRTQITEDSPVGSWTWDLVDDEMTWSRKLYPILGQDPNEVEASFEAYMECVHREDAGRVRGILEAAYATGESFDFAHRVVTPEDEARRVRCRGQVVLEGGDPVRMVGTVQDLSSPREPDRARQVPTVDEEDSPQELEGLSPLVHRELSDPVRMVVTSARKLAHSLDDELDVEAREHLDFVRDGARRIQRVLRELVTPVQGPTPTPDTDEVDLQRLVDEMLAELEARGEASDAVVQTRGLRRIQTDENLFSALLRRLLSCALTSQREELTPRIEVTLEREQDHWHLTVEDDGNGFGPDDPERSLHAFEPPHAGDDVPGTGHGLAICKPLVRKLGGSIDAQSQPDEGTALHVRIPIASTRREHPPEPRRDRRLRDPDPLP